jgi:hypothetical protein
MDKAMIDYYRCPPQFINLHFSGQLLGQSGYFRFGSDSICYGRCSSGFVSRYPTDALFDAASDVTVKNATICLPFDLDEVIDNLRHERYALEPSNSYPAHVAKGIVRSLYYSVRPWMPPALRKVIQKVGLSGWRKIPFPHWPVDRTVERILEKTLILSMLARRVNRIPFIWFWPNGATGCASMTHDVETLQGRNFCSTLMSVDETFGIKASFQIVPEERYAVSESFLAGILQRGFEINVQDLNHDGHLFEDRQEFLRRAKRINQYVRDYRAEGFRSAIMYRNAEWLEALEIAYDMSIPNVAHLEPQRGGCCTVMPYFIGKILELPLTTSEDYSLFEILDDYSIDLWKQQANPILESSGLISFVTHPDYLIEQRPLETYKQLLEFLVCLREKRKVWIALPGEINRWWRERHQMNLVEKNGRWEVEGPGREKARVAYASFDGQSLQYTFD